jgi:hypothetical protein
MASRKFSATTLMSMTMPFIMTKLVIRVVASFGTLAIFALVFFLFSRGNMQEITALIVLIVAVLASGTVHFLLVRVLGYAARVGHIAVLTETIKNGRLPDNQVAYGADMVKKRLASAAVFWAINKLVDRAVQQLQNRLGGLAGGLARNVPGAGAAVEFGKTFLKKALSYIDECCIAWIFYNSPEQSAWKGALDGVAIYAQNWKKVLGAAVRTAIWSTVTSFLLYGGTFVLAAALIFNRLSNGTLTTGYAVLVVLLYLLALTIKQVLFDTWAMIRMMNAFLEVAPTTEIKFDMYGKLSSMSPAFRQMTQNARNDFSDDPFAPQRPAAAPPRPTAPGGAVFCGQCGARNPAGTAFCGDCGQRV